MDNVRRLIFVLLLFYVGSANSADVQIKHYWIVKSTINDYFSGVDSTAVCTSYAASLKFYTGQNYSFSSVTTGGICKFNNGTGAISSWPLSSATCMEPSQQFSVVTNTCIATPCVLGEVVSSGFYDGGKSATADFPYSVCLNACKAEFAGQWTYSQAMRPDGMHYYAKGSYVKSGLTCSSGTNPPSPLSATPKTLEQESAEAQAAAEAAAAAQKKADAKAAADAKTAADKAAASAAAADSKAKADKAAADKAAADAAAAKAAADAADSTKTQAQKDASTAAAAAAASNAASSGAAAAAAAGAAAAAAKPDTPAETKDFCELHPTSFICKNSSINAGYCNKGKVSGYTCEGDASLCEIAKQEVTTSCLLSDTDDTLTAKYNEAKNDNPANNSSLPQNSTTVNIPTALDHSSAYGAGQCNPDVTISFNGSSVVIPFSKWCDVLFALGYLFLACAYISAAIILGGAI